MTVLFSCGPFTAPQVNRPFITAVYPSGDTVPENLLRLYVHFSKPMRTSGIMAHIRLVDQQGEPIQGAFFPEQDGLWDPMQQQLTLLLDPGRVKTGLQAHEQMGRALQRGQSVTLQIDTLQDVNGDWMPGPFQKTVWVGPPDTTAPDPQSWQVTPPAAGSKQALQLDFPDQLDEFSLRQRLLLTNAQNEPVPGEIHLTQQEQTWRLTPNDPWRTGEYRLYIHHRLEDPSGNNLNGLFDHPIGSLKYASEDQMDTLIIQIN